VTLNNVDSDFSDDIRRTVDRSVAEFDAPPLGFLGEQNGAAQGLLLPNVYRVAVAQHNLRHTTVDFLHYNLVPVLVLLVLNVGMLGTALLVAHDIERGTGKAIAAHADLAHRHGDRARARGQPWRPPRCCCRWSPLRLPPVCCSPRRVTGRRWGRCLP